MDSADPSVVSTSADPSAISAGAASEGGDAAAFGYVEVEDSGVVIYSGITRTAAEEGPSGMDSTAAGSQIHRPGASDPVAESSVTPADISCQVSAQPFTEEPGADEFLKPEDLGIRNFQPFISPAEQGGQLSVSVEVPEASAYFWKVEASADSESWTDSKDVVSHQFSSGTSPGFLRLTASIVQPVPIASHTLLRLKGKW